MAASYVTHFIHRALMIVSVAPTFLRMAMLQPMYPGKRRPRQPPPPLTAARARERAPDSTRATAQASRITMAAVTEQTPLAATEPRPKSINRGAVAGRALVRRGGANVRRGAVAGRPCFARRGKRAERAALCIGKF